MKSNSQPSEWFAYPTGAVRALLRLPIWLHRLGLGGLLHFLPLAILTTRGRKSGRPRVTALEYRQHGSKFYLVSAWGTQAHWVQNLLAQPMATLQQGGRSYAVRARLVEDRGEALRVLHLFRRIAPYIYDAVIARLSGEESVDVKTLPDVSGDITIVRLDILPNEAPPLPPVRADLAWVMPAGLVIGAATMALVLFTRARRS